MKANKVHDMSNEELVAKLEELKKELFNLRLNHATGQLNNPLALSVCKRTSRELRPFSERESCPKRLKGDATNGKNKQKNENRDGCF